MTRARCVFVSAAALAAIAGGVDAATFRVVNVPGYGFNFGFDAFNNGGAVGNAFGPFGSVGFISRTASTSAVTPPSPFTSLIFQSASATGSTLAGTTGLNGTAVRYTAAGGVQSLGALSALGHTTSEAWRISGDGSTIVGGSGVNTSTPRAFRWTAAGGMENLGTLPSTTSSVARAVNADGSVVVGESGGSAFRWSAANGMENLRTGTSFTTMTASAVSSDGTVVFGMGDGRPYRLSPQGLTLLNSTFGLGTGAQILDASDDGSTAVGAMNVTGSTRAVAWFGDDIFDLNVWLPLQGVNLGGWTLNTAIGISSDGRTIAATGQNNGVASTVVIVLDSPLPLLIPAPGAATLLAGAGLLAARRRR